MNEIPFLSIFARDYPLIMIIVFGVFLISTVVKLIKAFIRYVKKSDFDKIFDTKDQQSWETGYKQLMFTLILIIFSHLLGGGIAISIAENDNDSYFLILLGVLIIITLLISFSIIMVHLAIRKFVALYSKLIRKEEYELDYSKNKRYYKFLLLTHFVSAYFSIYCSSAFTTYRLMIKETDWLSLLGSILASTLFALVYFHFSIHLYRDEFKIENPAGKNSYKMIIPHIETVQNQPLFVLYSLDSNRIVLGNKPTEIESNHLYIYDRDKHRYLLFMRQESK
ncbi:hypothetical membrane protein [Brevibacillus brevis NBRC 100599]|uniref:Hypothetical membrane protein n=1 Tax=Brevibacillus brevis (strain 47 / JCM 6285 / NBRC 100599) TaxID=358681 RepID=C0Z6X9_BREBN|nr:hypothetical protein [Brevibacillus brevis]BAH43920.1 hypothetical membrane protein [Brevibacillus brevis NBRC 100599]BAH46328.1 hypothetical membrane protein [Brevibacillus brevis NBRC 100599]